jgi:hypothetical protein
MIFFLEPVSKNCHNFFFYLSDITTKNFGKKEIFSLFDFQTIFLVCLFPTKFHQIWSNCAFFTWKADFLPNLMKFCEIDNLKNYLELRQTECFFLNKNFCGNIQPIEKKIMVVFDSHSGYIFDRFYKNVFAAFPDWNQERIQIWLTYQ